MVKLVNWVDVMCSTLQVVGSQENRKRPQVSGGGSQFSIDELLRQDDKKSKFEADSKSISVGEVEPGDGEVISEDVTVKEEMEPKTAVSQNQ